jgi:hypothetical protein
MESIIIKREAVPYRSLVLLFIVLIPVVLFLYAMSEAHGTGDTIACGTIAFLFLLPAIIDFIANKIPLKAAIRISEQGLTLSSSKGLYDSFAFLQVFQRRRRKIISWQNIAGFKLLTYYSYFTSAPTDGTSSETYSVAKPQLCIKTRTNNEEVIFSLYGLEKMPDEILLLCNQYLEKFSVADSANI